jgi:ribosomal protein L37AE/L43A
MSLKHYEESGSFGERLVKKFEGKMDNLMVCPECGAATINMFANGECQCRNCGLKYNLSTIPTTSAEASEGVTKDKPYVISREDGPGRATKIGNNFATKEEAEAAAAKLPKGFKYTVEYNV